MRLGLLASIAVAASLVMAGPSLADKAKREANKAERTEKKAERQERKADRKSGERADKVGMGKFDKNHDGVMSSTSGWPSTTLYPAGCMAKNDLNSPASILKTSPVGTLSRSRAKAAGLAAPR
jgi:hypothetical protein